MNAEKKRKSRRKFLVRAALGGTAVLIGATYLGRGEIRKGLAGFANSAELPYGGNTKKPMLWFEVNAQNEIILHSPKVEMGQGSLTSMAQIVADEMEVDFEKVKVVHAQTASGNIDPRSTGGSDTISSLWKPLRELSATMREMLRIEASKKLGVDVASTTLTNGVFNGGGKSLTFGQVVDGVTDWKIPKTPELKPVSEYKFVGKPMKRIDLKAKVVGEPIFGMDATMPDMLYGAVARSKKIGAKFKSADTSAAENMPGVVKVVQQDDFVGVVATSRMEAEKAKQALKVEWETERDWQTEDIEKMIRVGEGTPITIQDNGRAKRLLKDGQEGVISAEYSSPIGAHAQLEPNGAVAHVEGDKVTIKMSTQVVGFTQKEVAKSLGLKADNVNVVPTYLGGGFGRRLHTPNAIQAALMSKAVGKPVKSFLTRKEEFQHDTFRPPTHHVLKAKLSENGLIEAIEHNLSSGDVAFGSAIMPGILEPVLGADAGAWRGGMIQYSGIPNRRAVSWRVKLPFATSFWRSLGLLANTFAIESFMDELALQVGQDPIEFRLAQIKDDEAGKRLSNVIKTAAEKANYKDVAINGRAMGFAASTDATTPCAQVAEVSIEKGEIKVHKVTCVMDPGLAVNPDQVRAQCEGSIIMGLSASCHERMYIKDSQLKPTIYGPYNMALMRHAPKEIDIHLLQGREEPGPVGEPPLGPIGAAIANAVFRLTGKRLRSLPLDLNA